MAAPKRDPIAERVVPETPDTPPRREGAPATVPPDSLAPVLEPNAADGSVAQHPVHDDDLEDLDPEDYEAEIDELEQTGGLRPD
jgi:hypothetical protein